jgi:hypothetical protein
MADHIWIIGEKTSTGTDSASDIEKRRQSRDHVGVAAPQFGSFT